MRGARAASDAAADDAAWRLHFPSEPSREVASSLRDSDARLERRWRAFVANGRDARARGELVRAFTRANGVGREARPRLWFAWSGAEAAKRASDITYEEYLRAAEAASAASTTRDAQIEMDLARTFPEHARFAEEGDALPALRRVLRATATSAAAGYVQGMNYLGGFLLLVMETEEDAFWTLHVVVDVMFAGYFAEGLKSLRADLDTLDHRFRCVSSEAHAKLESMGLAVKYFTARWLMCALIGCASVPIVLRVWDLIFVDADREPRETIMRSSLAILALQAPWIRAAEDMNSSVECIREAGVDDRQHRSLSSARFTLARDALPVETGAYARSSDTVPKEDDALRPAADAGTSGDDARGQHAVLIARVVLLAHTEQNGGLDAARERTRAETFVEL